MSILITAIYFCATASAFQLKLEAQPVDPKVIDGDQIEIQLQMSADQAFTLYGYHTIIRAPDGIQSVENTLLPEAIEVAANTNLLTDTLKLQNLPAIDASDYEVTILPLGWIGTKTKAEGPLTRTLTFKAH